MKTWVKASIGAGLLAAAGVVWAVSARQEAPTVYRGVKVTPAMTKANDVLRAGFRGPQFLPGTTVYESRELCAQNIIDNAVDSFSANPGIPYAEHLRRGLGTMPSWMWTPELKDAERRLLVLSVQ